MTKTSTISSAMIHPFLGRDVPWLLRTRAETTPDAPFLVWESLAGEDRAWNCAAFAAVVEDCAANLAARDIGPGDRVMIHLDNCPEFLFLWFACARIGAIAVTTNTRCPADEIAYFAAHSRAALAITQPKYAAAVRASMNAGLPVLVRQRDPGLEAVVPIAGGCLPLDALFVPADRLPATVPDPARPVSVQYTSGTTSRPKGVVWTHANALWAAKVNAVHAGIGADDVTPVFLPLFHTNAIGYSTLASLWSGGTIVLQPRFSASRFWGIALRHRCTWANMIGFTIKSLIGREAPAAHDFRFWACASDVAPIRALWGIKTIGWWGMTETVSHGIVADRGWPNAEMGMGHAAAEYGVRILSDDGEPVAPGGSGKLQIQGVRGLSLFLEYLDDIAATEAAFTEDGWLDTGDMVTLTPSGDLFFAEREKDMLKIGGENVAASEIERVLMGFPGVAEAAVVGRPDDMLDEVAVAFIVAAPGIEAAAVLAHCAQQLADFKVPRAVHFLDELPKGTLDKVLKRDLRARLV